MTKLPKNTAKKSSSSTDDTHSCFLAFANEAPAVTSDQMLQYYLDEGQPAFTDRLVHGQHVSTRSRIKGLKRTMKNIDQVLAKPGDEYDSSANPHGVAGATDQK